MIPLTWVPSDHILDSQAALHFGFASTKELITRPPATARLWHSYGLENWASKLPFSLMCMKETTGSRTVPSFLQQMYKMMHAMNSLVPTSSAALLFPQTHFPSGSEYNIESGNLSNMNSTTRIRKQWIFDHCIERTIKHTSATEAKKLAEQEQEHRNAGCHHWRSSWWKTKAAASNSNASAQS
jgi:hypothetical protein